MFFPSRARGGVRGLTFLSALVCIRNQVWIWIIQIFLKEKMGFLDSPRGPTIRLMAWNSMCLRYPNFTWFWEKREGESQRDSSARDFFAMDTLLDGFPRCGFSTYIRKGGSPQILHQSFCWLIYRMPGRAFRTWKFRGWCPRSLFWHQGLKGWNRNGW